MSLETWITFLIACIAICGTPGPNMLQVMTSGARHGFSRATATMAGCLLAVLLVIGLSIAGLGAALAALPQAFDVLRVAGAAYLIYLGVKAWCAPVVEVQEENARFIGNAQPYMLFRQGLLVGLSNPKLILFAAAFFPQFINPHAPKLPQCSVLLGTFVTVEVSWYITYALGGRSLSRYLHKARAQRLFNKISGGLFTVFGLMLLKFRAA